METEQIETRIDRIEDERTGLYSLFEEKGGKAVNIFYHAEPEEFHIPYGDEVYSNVDEEDLVPPRITQEGFESIVNFLSRAEILPTWNNSAPFRILMDEVDEQDLATAYEYVSGEQYNFPKSSEPVNKDNSIPDYLKS